MSEINTRSIEEGKPPMLEDWKLIGHEVVRAEVIGHAEIEDGEGISLDAADVTLPSHSGTPYTSATEAPRLLRAGVELQTENTLYQLGQESREGPVTSILY